MHSIIIVYFIVNIKGYQNTINNNDLNEIEAFTTIFANTHTIIMYTITNHYYYNHCKVKKYAPTKRPKITKKAKSNFIKSNWILISYNNKVFIEYYYDLY